MPESCENVMTRNVQTCHETDPVSRAAQLMRECNIGMIPVVDSMQKLAGVVTDRDLTVRVIAENMAGNTPLKDVLTRAPLLTVHPQDTLECAEQKMMEAGKGRILVTDKEDRVVGVISRSEIARAEPASRAGEVLGSLTRSHRSGAVH